MVGNTVVWKPSLTSSLACWTLYELLRAAGLPEGVIQLVNGEGADVGDLVLADPRLGGVHFTGSTGTFQRIWATVGQNLPRYRTYPRLVGETGGKDFILAHASAHPLALATAIVRGGYEFQGQKCSAPSRVYVPESLWPVVRDLVHDMVQEMKQGDVRDFSNFVGAVIDERAFRKHERYLQAARTDAELVVGGTADDRRGWFVAPTFTRVNDPRHVLLHEEVFGPIVAGFVYNDEQWEETLQLVDRTSPYALTGAVFARERGVIEQASRGLRHAAGNFYINDKPTGAVVGQQPFGGGRASGTNDKAGAPQNLLRWISPRSIKETFVPPTGWRYPFLG
jgi:1-pyrroline-5-carboxylate dehydrogenase